jgi:M6 family metalloprotease-like protein
LSVAEAQIVVLVPNAMPNTGLASVRGVNAGTVSTPQRKFKFPERPIVIFSLKTKTHPTASVDPIRALAAVAHELSHAFFNLPDRYGAKTGTGEYDMMGSANSSKWLHLPMTDKVKIGWIRPKIVRAHTGKCLQFVASAIQDAALIVVPIDQFLNNHLEYWVVENRHKKYDQDGYDEDLPDDALRSRLAGTCVVR